MKLLINSIVGVLALAIAALFVHRAYTTRATVTSLAEGGDLSGLIVLQKKGQSLDFQDERKFLWTPLLAATFAEQTNVVAYLLTQKIDVKLKDSSGRTALMLALLDPEPNMMLVRLFANSGYYTNIFTDSETMFFVTNSPRCSDVIEIFSSVTNRRNELDTGGVSWRQQPGQAK